ncbi:hypothetical protein [Streptomyces nanshensis]|nr:hypothetical protein [Streptomyces nanshensis]
MILLTGKTGQVRARVRQGSNPGGRGGKCPAQAALTAAQARLLNALPGAGFDAGTEPLGCDFASHGPEVRHSACVQMQDTGSGEGLVLHWLLWGEDGSREIRIALDCPKLVVDETCLLIDGHPGPCDQDIGFTPEELRRALGLPGRPPEG